MSAPVAKVIAGFGGYGVAVAASLAQATPQSDALSEHWGLLALVGGGLLALVAGGRQVIASYRDFLGAVDERVQAGVSRALAVHVAAEETRLNAISDQLAVVLEHLQTPTPARGTPALLPAFERERP